MKDPQITWYIVENDSSMIPREEHFMGTCLPGNTIEVNIQLWNNRWGSENVASTQGSKLTIYFDSIEDSFLLNLCKVKIDDGAYEPLRIEAYKGYVDLTRELSGLANDGTSSNTSNYINIAFRFGPSEKGLRNSLKSLIMTLESDSQEISS